MRATQTLNTPTQNDADNRVAWVDYAKGFCILLVVMFHTVNHYEEAVGATGWMRHLVDFSKPFRMPDFFMISGLFLSRTVNAALPKFLDRKVVHFVYFYLLWLVITLVVTDHDVLRDDPVRWLGMVGWNILQPVGSLWFVHMLAIFYVVTRLVRTASPILVLAVAAAFQIAHQALWIDTPSFAINRAMDYYVFFFLGYWASGFIFRVADRVRAAPREMMLVLAVWGVANYILTSRHLHELPVIGLVTGLLGAFAVVIFATLLQRANLAGFLRYCGQNSIVIYLTFYFPMLALQRVLANSNAIPDVGWACAFILVVSAVLPLAFHRLIRKTPLSFLYERPAAFRIGEGKEPKLAIA